MKWPVEGNWQTVSVCGKAAPHSRVTLGGVGRRGRDLEDDESTAGLLQAAAVSAMG